MIKKDFWQSQKLIQNHKQEGCGEGGDDIKCVDEGSEWLIFCCIRVFEDKQTDRQMDGHLWMQSCFHD